MFLNQIQKKLIRNTAPHAQPVGCGAQGMGEGADIQ